MFVSSIDVIIFSNGLAPSKVISIFLWSISTYITGRPQGSTWQTKINIFMTIICVFPPPLLGSFSGLHPAPSTTAVINIKAVKAFESLFIIDTNRLVCKNTQKKEL